MKLLIIEFFSSLSLIISSPNIPRASASSNPPPPRGGCAIPTFTSNKTTGIITDLIFTFLANRKTKYYELGGNRSFSLIDRVLPALAYKNTLATVLTTVLLIMPLNNTVSASYLPWQLRLPNYTNLGYDTRYPEPNVPW